MSCFVYAHINNAIAPGSFERTLHQSLKDNGLAEFKAPNCPDSTQLFPNTQVMNENETMAANQRVATPPPIYPAHSSSQGDASSDEEAKGVEEDADSEGSDVSVVSRASRTSHNLAAAPMSEQQHRPIIRSENPHTHVHHEHTEHPQRPTTSSNKNKHTNKDLSHPNTQVPAKKIPNKNHKR